MRDCVILALVGLVFWLSRPLSPEERAAIGARYLNELSGLGWTLLDDEGCEVVFVVD